MKLKVQEDDKRLIKEIEVVIAIVAVIIGFFLFGQYFILNEDLNPFINQPLDPENSIGAPYLFDPELSLKKEVSSKDIRIIKKGNGWISDYPNITFDSNDKGNLVLNFPFSENEKIYADFVDLRSYASKEGSIETTIPYDGSSFRIYEQEDYIPIFGYHRVIPDDQEIRFKDTEIHQGDFDKQMHYATYELGCNWITMSELASYVVSRSKLPRNACVITFDDGTPYDYNYAFPILEKYNIKATFYVIVGQIGEKNYRMTWEQLDELFLHGHDIQSHSYNVTEGIVSENLSSEEITYQLRESKRILEERYGSSVTSFAYPLGEWSPAVIGSLEEEGYLLGRDSSKDFSWLYPSTPSIFDEATSFYEDNTEGNNNSGVRNNGPWHMFYYKPEYASLEDINTSLGYHSWWQFEENYIIVRDYDGDINSLSTGVPTNLSYGLLRLMDRDDTIKVPFMLEKKGSYTVEVVLSKDDGTFSKSSVEGNPAFKIDDALVPLDHVSNCFKESGWTFCTYELQVDLDSGRHYIEVRSTKDILKLDKFRMYRTIDAPDYYIVDLRTEKWV